jgi:hypothetical protein
MAAGGPAGAECITSPTVTYGSTLVGWSDRWFTSVMRSGRVPLISARALGANDSLNARIILIEPQTQCPRSSGG